MTGQTAWNVMFLGRAIFGMGGESLSVAQSAIIAKWFSGKELALALGLNLALARVGSVVNDAISIQVWGESQHIPHFCTYLTTCFLFFIDCYSQSSLLRLLVWHVCLFDLGYR